MRIGLDMYGGDHAPGVTLDGAVSARNELDGDYRLVLYGNEEEMRAGIRGRGGNEDDFDYVHAPDVILMNDNPTRSIPKKPDSSIARGILDLANKDIHVFASAGNTGALLVGGMFKIGPIQGIIRPCITSLVPKLGGRKNLLLDVGANADVKPDVLYQFAILGKVYMEQIMDVENPKVGLLNIGEEPGKGNLLTQSAYQLMHESDDFNFIGNVEGSDLFDDAADIMVCDGFTGNIMLKEAEAFYAIAMRRKLKDEFFDNLNYENYGGTPILGLGANIIVGHGRSTAKAIKNMCQLAHDVAKGGLADKIQQAFRQ